MTEFNPAPHDQLTIGGHVYHVMPHPSVPSFAFGQEGRKAFVYQLSNGGGRLYALKKFKQAYRLSELVEVCVSLARFADWQGLEVCDRQCLNEKSHKDALQQFPDLEYAVLMAWIEGSTWYDILVGKRALSRLDALKMANATSQVLSALEEAGLAHCDVAAPNVIIDLYQGQAHLIDVEDLYAPGFSSPVALPAGTDGYAHKAASQGLWSASADRFAGAVLLSEMAAWHSPTIREAAEDEHYFDGREMQVDSPRYRLMRDTLNDIHPDLGNLLDQAWASETLEDCPRLHEWYSTINQVFQEEYHREQVAPIVSGWQSIAAPAAQPETPSQPVDPSPTPAAAAPDRVASRPIIVPPPADSIRTAAVPSVPARPLTSPRMPTDAGPITAPPPVSPVVEWRPLGVSASPPPATTQPGQDGETAASGLIKPILTVRVDSQNRPYAAWSESSGATDYVLHESDNETFEKHQEYRIKAPQTIWEPPRFGWRRAYRYYYRVRARNKQASGPWSEPVGVDIG